MANTESVADVLARAQPHLEALNRMAETVRRAGPALEVMSRNARYLEDFARRVSALPVDVSQATPVGQPNQED